MSRKSKREIQIELELTDLSSQIETLQRERVAIEARIEGKKEAIVIMNKIIKGKD